MNQENLVQAYAPNKEKLAELVTRAKGKERTMAQFALATGISAPTLSRLANGKINNPLTEELLRKIYDARSEDADFTYSVLLMANGMVDPKVVERGKNFVEGLTSKAELGVAIERHARNAIVNAVMARGVAVQFMLNEHVSRGNAPYGITPYYDFCLHVPSEEHQLWYFDVVEGSRRTPAGSGNAVNRAARLFLLDSWTPDYFTNQKRSFIFTNRPAYEDFINRFKGAPINAAVSAILVNAETEELVDETWMSATPEVPGIFAKAVIESTKPADWEDDESDE